MQDKVEVVRCDFEKRVNLARFNNYDISSIEGYWSIVHNDCAATLGNKANFVQPAMEMSLDNALVSKAFKR